MSPKIGYNLTLILSKINIKLTHSCLSVLNVPDCQYRMNTKMPTTRSTIKIMEKTTLRAMTTALLSPGMRSVSGSAAGQRKGDRERLESTEWGYQTEYGGLVDDWDKLKVGLLFQTIRPPSFSTEYFVF